MWDLWLHLVGWARLLNFTCRFFYPLLRVLGFFLLLKTQLFMRTGSIHEILEHFMDQIIMLGNSSEFRESRVFSGCRKISENFPFLGKLKIREKGKPLLMTKNFK